MSIFENKYLLNISSQYFYGKLFNPEKIVEWRNNNISNPFNKIYFIINGECYFEIAGEKFTAKPGMIVLIPEETLHSFSCPDTSIFKKYWFHFRMVVDGKNFFETLHLPYHITVKEEEFEETKKLFSDVISTAVSDEFMSTFLLHSLILRIISFYISHTEENTKHNMNTNYKSIDVAINYIKDNLDKKISVSFLADLLHMNENYFIRIFKNRTGYTPAKYIKSLRMERAKSLLRNSSMPIKQIMYLVGYNESDNFSRAFKKLCDRSPSEYRNWQKSSEY